MKKKEQKQHITDIMKQDEELEMYKMGTDKFNNLASSCFGGKPNQWYNESKTDERMNVIGQNGNDGEHYESENTAVDWLTERLKFDFGIVFSDNIFEKAKEIEKQQIKDAYDVKWVEFIVNGEDYYNQKFKKK